MNGGLLLKCEPGKGSVGEKKGLKLIGGKGEKGALGKLKISI